MTTETTTLQPWWGSTEVADGQHRYWRIGPVEFWLSRHGPELRVAHRTVGDPLSTELVRGEVVDAPPEDLPGERLHVGAEAETVSLVPRCADRAVVARAEEPLVLFPGGQTTVFVSTPCWLELHCGVAEHAFVLGRMTDTWFGPDTRRGDLAYASMTRLRRHPDRLARTPHRLSTRVEILNQGVDPVWIRRMRLPLPQLPAYGDASGRLWTSGVEVIRTKDPSQADIRVMAGAPLEAPDALLLSDARASEAQQGLRAIFTLLA